ncbi:MAG TPA: flavodoxin-dependent (E)-4-hydroxy-3-methylbut-2-enyl-diphosphate synthase [Deltaproteobacteria bacterium]|nr:flavodoxin-dependent (E)-4-hydroxy-3-methylbut-2-enyl-diphosphate synthase [Deltaproteobacteria bacterium]HPR53873.1 flavodoxin-dependent (E)-4-hydroxy-3-methylbut-2-enyl-diphosphate synthase [Deltaproteobacteria bacterium]HXK45927.1 flavodoxin-dependent (E)-4-hydroxy-3-methylbut-2-enyl-diphosphate synthase [Deltaproteobacteria bacterium]
MTPHREQTRRIFVGTCPVGGGSRISIQSMTNTVTTDVEATLDQIHALVKAGCDIVRVSVPDDESVKAFGRIKERCLIPVIADIHFDHRLAIGAIEQGADAIRINPGNIGGKEKLMDVARAAMDRGVPMRVGVNLGSVKRSLLSRYGDDHVGAIVESGRQYVEMLEDMGVDALKVSLKSSDVLETIDAYRRFSKVSAWPLHLGVTEAGPLISGLIRSSVGIGALLEEGIGDTIRVSLSADPVQEVFAGRILLECLGLRAEGVRVIACPTCARACADVASISTELEDALKDVRRHMVVAVMGCVVNGPGEAKIADLGVACDAKGAVLFAHGKKVRRIAKDEIITTIVNEIHKETPS